MMNANLMFPSVKFQGVQIVMQSKTWDKRQIYNANREERLLKKGPATIVQESPLKTVYQDILRKNNAFLDQQKSSNSADPKYRGILFDCGEIANPLRPDTICAQSLYVDGEDVDRFAVAVGRSILAPGTDLGGDDDAKSSVRRAGMVPTFTNVWGPVKVKWYQEAISTKRGKRTRFWTWMPRLLQSQFIKHQFSKPLGLVGPPRGTVCLTCPAIRRSPLAKASGV